MPDKRTSTPRPHQYLDASELFVLSFAATILAGALVLMLPTCTATGSISFVDALFTSTSAVCVTGLAVVDIGTSFTRTGHVVIMGLIQLGGLGIMTFSVLMLLFAGRRVSLRSRLIVQDSFVPMASGETLSLVRRLFVITGLAELAGAAVFWISTPDRHWFSALFHAVSAFCNAGFSLRPNNLMDYRLNFGVNLSIGGLIVLGGLGFFNVVELLRVVRRRASFRPSLHSRLVWTVTVALIVGGALVFAVFEWRNTLRADGVPGAVLVSLFQSITPRTAGFNTIDFGMVSNATLFATIMLMFIGASPGSTGGGVKTTTLGILLALARARFYGVEQASVFRRTIPARTVSKAISVLVLGFVVVTFAVLLLCVTEMGSQAYNAAEFRFVEVLFEIVSAFGTVGLSTGITPRLSSLGKIIVVVVMFIGRVGPLTLATAVALRESRAKYRYAEENVMVG